MSVNFADYEGTPLSEEETQKIPLLQRKMRSRLGCVLCFLIIIITLPNTVVIVPPLLLLVWLGLLKLKPVQLFFDWYTGLWYNIAIVSRLIPRPTLIPRSLTSFPFMLL